MKPTREQTEDAKERVLARVREVRRLAGMMGLSPTRAELRQRALEAIPADAFLELLKLPDDERFAMIRALEAGDKCYRATIAVVAIDPEDRYLWRWACSCGAKSQRDYFGRDDATAGWRLHAGVMDSDSGPEPEAAPALRGRKCELPGCARPVAENRQYCTDVHRRRHARARQRANELRLDTKSNP